MFVGRMRKEQNLKDHKGSGKKKAGIFQTQ
jgi:hypothetical protein